MAASLAVTAPSSVQNLMKSSSRRFDGKSMSLDDRDYLKLTFLGTLLCEDTNGAKHVRLPVLK